MMDLKPHASLTNTLSVLLKLTIGLTSLAVLVGIYEFHAYSNLPSDFDVAEVLLPSEIVSGVLGFVRFGLAIATGITFLRWIYRTNNNLRALSGDFMEFTPGWSVGWYFVPIANLWKPYQAMKEIWEVSHRDNQADSQSILTVWWMLYVASGVLGRIAFRHLMSAHDASSYATSTMIYMVSDGVDVILAVVALVMVTRIGAAYSQNFVETAPAQWLESFE